MKKILLTAVAALFAVPMVAHAIIPPCQVLEANARQEYERKKSEAMSPAAQGPLVELEKGVRTYIFLASGLRLKTAEQFKEATSYEPYNHAELSIEAKGDSIALVACTEVPEMVDIGAFNRYCITVDLKRSYIEQLKSVIAQSLVLQGVPATSNDYVKLHVPKYCQQSPFSLPLQNVSDGSVKQPEARTSSDEPMSADKHQPRPAI